ncbi:hypothetical protein ACFL35_05010 [Candidatus Riflebacteria bacterium]
MKILKILFLLLLTGISVFLSDYYIHNLGQLEFEEKKKQILREERENVEKLKLGFIKTSLTEEIIQKLIEELEKNPFDQQHVKDNLIKFNERFKSKSSSNKSPLSFWYLNHKRQLVQWDDTQPIKSRKVASEIMLWFFLGNKSTKRKQYFQKKGRFKYFFGEKFPYNGTKGDNNQFKPFYHMGKGVRVLYWSLVLDRNKRPEALRKLKNFKIDEKAGLLLCILDWRVFSPKLLGKLGIINKNSGSARSRFASFSPGEGIKESVFPAIEENYVSTLKKNKNRLSSVTQHFFYGDTVLTTTPFHRRAKTWNYKAGVSAFHFQIDNYIGQEYILSIRPLDALHNEILNYYQNLKILIICLLLSLFLLLLYLELAGFVGIKFKLILAIVFLVGVPFFVYFAYEIRRIQSLRSVKFLEKKKELFSKLTGFQQKIQEERENLLALCRALRDERDYNQITREDKSELLQRLSKIPAFKAVLIYDRKLKPLLLYRYRDRVKGKDNQIIKSMITQIWPYLVKMEVKLKDRILNQMTGDLYNMLLGGNPLRLLEKMDELREIQFGKDVTTFYLDYILDDGGDLKYIIALAVRVNLYMRDILAGRTLDSHIGENLFQLYFFQPDSFRLTPATAPKKWVMAFKEKCTQKYSGYLEDDFDSDYLFAVHYLEKFGFLLVMTFPKEPIERELKSMQKKLVFNLSAIFLFLLAGVLFFSYRILNPINKIKESG